MTKEQKLINELQEYLDIEDTSGIDLYPEEVQMCIDALEKQTWISVRDKLPELNHFVFVTKRSEGDIFYGKLIVDIACYSKKDFKDEFYWRDWNLNEMKNEILAWMPMNFPKPYMEDKIDG